jgi:hypothetical protein
VLIFLLIINITRRFLLIKRSSYLALRESRLLFTYSSKVTISYALACKGEYACLFCLSIYSTINFFYLGHSYCVLLQASLDTAAAL